MPELGDLYVRLRLVMNFFLPQARLVSKTSEGAKVTRRYDSPLRPMSGCCAPGS